MGYPGGSGLPDIDRCRPRPLDYGKREEFILNHSLTVESAFDEPAPAGSEDTTYGDRAIAQTAFQRLECWENLDGPFHIHLEHPEFTALCPRSGYPDMGTIVIDYIPDEKVLELRAFKLYINSFRTERISHERVANKIIRRFQKDVEPVSVRVIGDFTRRGGVKTIVTAERGAEKDLKFPDYRANIL